jgi:hypothetical protein
MLVLPNHLQPFIKNNTFKEYIREELTTFSEGMSTAMKKCLNYVVVSGEAFHELASDVAALTLGQ